ncbi:MAG: hypothetical protein MZV65_52355 [Chromatiales bacterium]|nr:hypothetical protein [Chromatiales bacterium]
MSYGRSSLTRGTKTRRALHATGLRPAIPLIFRRGETAAPAIKCDPTRVRLDQDPEARYPLTGRGRSTSAVPDPCRRHHHTGEAGFHVRITTDGSSASLISVLLWKAMATPCGGWQRRLEAYPGIRPA